ncbi:hypothetical protein CR152_12325 [Massilia violaceinigra]|uniref:Gluconolaconase n=1 Tax=Massilia violaceinigra TaxID=2045208 RepID=A0A2D2DJT5_9BURK|nr:hypothetical protein CR152_12325 [Massilia violaceinigra]
MLPAGLTLIAGDTGSMVTTDGTGVDARFGYIRDALIDSKGTVYVSETRIDNRGIFVGTGPTIRAFGRDGVVRTVLSAPVPADEAHASLDPTGAVLSFDRDEQIRARVGLTTYLIRKDGSTTQVPTELNPTYPDQSFIVGNAAGVRYRINYSSEGGGTSIARIGADGSLTALAGSTVRSSEPRDGQGAAARFAAIGTDGMVVDPAGNLYLIDAATIRRVTPGGLVSTLAGVANSTLPAQDGSGSGAYFDEPRSIVMHDGQLLVLDKTGLRHVSTDGAVTSVGPKLTASPRPLSVTDTQRLLSDGQGNVYAIHRNHVSLIVPDGGASLFVGKPDLSRLPVDGTGAAARLVRPKFMTADSAGNLFVVEQQHIGYRMVGYEQAGVYLRKVAPDGTTTSTVTYGGYPSGIAADRAGNVYVSTLHYIAQVHSATPGGAVIHKLGSDGVWSVFAGADGERGKQDGIGAAARFNAPTILGFDNAGDLYVQDEGNGYRRISPAGAVTTVAAVPLEVGRVGDDAGNRYVADTERSTISRISAAGVSSIVAGIPDRAATVLGPLPGSIEHPRGLVRIGINSYAFISGSAIVRLALP